MTAVTLLLSAPNGAYAQTDMHTASRDPNARFLCTYGGFLVSFTYSSFGQFYSFDWKKVAVPVTGHGQTVSRIKVIEAPNHSNTSSSGVFYVGIYSNTPSGLPGNPIAWGTGYAGSTCGPVDVRIAPTKLKRSTKYWIEETLTGYGYPSSYVHHAARWMADPKVKHKAYVQTHHNSRSSSGVFSSYTSPWTQQSMGPYLKLK